MSISRYHLDLDLEVCGVRHRARTISGIRVLWFEGCSTCQNNGGSRKALPCQITGMGIKFANEILGLLLLNSLFESWEENKGKKGKSKEKDDDDDDDDNRVTTATVNFVSDESMWIIDSSATLHVTPRNEFFTSGDFGVLKMGNDGDQ
ncbi:hypothetical protein CR513_59041, partial [Mucuna pruriens]